MCYGCRHPITMADKKLKSFKKGVHCKYCINSKTTKKFMHQLQDKNRLILLRKKKNYKFLKNLYAISYSFLYKLLIIISFNI